MDEEKFSLEDDVVCNTDGEALVNATLKEKAICRMSAVIYGDEDYEDLLSDAMEYCMRNGNEFVSMEEYVNKNFSSLICKFSELHDQYIRCIKQRNQKLRRNARTKRKRKLSSKWKKKKN